MKTIAKTKTRNALYGLTSGLLLLASGTSANAQNVIVNGSFEDSPLGVNGPRFSGPFPAAGAGWENATDRSAFYAYNLDPPNWLTGGGWFWPAPTDGNQAARMAGSVQKIWQTVKVTPGVEYTLTYDFGGGKTHRQNPLFEVVVYRTTARTHMGTWHRLVADRYAFQSDEIQFTPNVDEITLVFSNWGTIQYGNVWLDNVVLKPTNSPPIVSCPPAATIPCTSSGGATRTVTIDVADADNDALTVTWTVNGVALAPHLLGAGATSDNLTDYPFGFGLNTVSVSVTDGNSAAVTCDTTVAVTAHDAPVPSLSNLPTITGECSASITQAPTATDPCAVGGIVTGVSSLGPLPLNFTAQGTYTVTWTYTSPHDGMLSTTQDQTVIVKDITPPTITCPPDVSVAFGSVPAAATDPAGFLAQGGTITDNCDPNGSVTSFDLEGGYCPTIITRFYVVTDAAGNESTCVQTITVNNLFAEDGILWLQPLARKGMSSDTDPSDGGTLKYRFKLGSTIPIKVQAQGCDGNVSSNANVGGKIVVFGDTDMDGVIDANEGELLIDYNGVGEAGGVMDKVDGKLQFNLDTKKLVQTFKCYILQVTVTDSSTGESRTEIVPLQAK